MNRYLTRGIILLAMVVCHCLYWAFHYGVLEVAYGGAYYDTSWQLFKDAVYFQNFAFYLEGFLFSFFKWKWLGIIILLIPILGVYFITCALLSQLKAGQGWDIFAFLPALLMMEFQHYEPFFLIKSIVLLVLLLSVAICCLLRDRRWRWMLLILVAGLVIFLSKLEMGILCVVLLFSDLIFSNDRERYVLSACYAGCGIAFFVLYEKSLETIPIFQEETPWMLVALIALVLLVSFVMRWGRLRECNALWFRATLLLLVLLALGCTFLPDKQMDYRERCGRIDMALLADDYDEILNLTVSEKKKVSEFYPYRIYALAKKGQLAEELFKYSISVATFMPEALPLQPGRQSVLNICYFRSLGLLNEAIHQAFQLGISCKYGDTFRSLCLLADLNIEKGDFILAEKYLAKLDKTLVHGDFVRSRRTLIASNPEPIANPDFDEYLYINKDQLMNLGYSLYIAKNRSAFVKDYFLCSLLLLGEYSQFCECYYDLYPNEDKVPRVYAEALVMARDMLGKDVKTVFPASVETDWHSFVEGMSYNPPMVSRWKGSWWYYSTFVLEGIE